MGVALWDDIVLDKRETYCYCCVKDQHTYGQVIVYDKSDLLAIDLNIPKENATVIKK